MEETKKTNEQNTMPNANGGNGGRRRRRKHRGGHGGNASQNTQQNVQQNAQHKPQQPHKGQNAQGEKQNGEKANPQKNPQQNGQGKKKKNKRDKNRGQTAQNEQSQATQEQNVPKQNAQKANKEENRKDTYLYVLDGNLYVNLTNKCSNGCDFCVRNERSSYYGNYLWLRNGDPTVEKVIAAAKGYGDLTRFKEVVFCGFGEPTYKVAEMVELCDFFHEKGLKTRLNTNGQGNLINKRDIVPDLKGKVDFVNVSLNASCVEKYQPICRSQYGEAGFAGMIEFAKLCRKNGVDCRFSIVDCIGEEEVEACKRLAESIKVPLYISKYISDS